jgi:hypothetical protein
MHNSGPDPAAHGEKTGEMIKQTVNQGTGLVTRCRMDHPTGRLIKHDKMIVLVQRIEFNGFGYNIRGFGRGNTTLNFFSGAYPVRRLHDLAVQTDKSVPDQTGGLCTGTLAKMTGNDAVQTLTGIAFAGGKDKSAGVGIHY